MRLEPQPPPRTHLTAAGDGHGANSLSLSSSLFLPPCVLDLFFRGVGSQPPLPFAGTGGEGPSGVPVEEGNPPSLAVGARRRRPQTLMDLELPYRLSSSPEPLPLAVAWESSLSPDSKPPRRARRRGYGRHGAGVACTGQALFPPDLAGLPRCWVGCYGWRQRGAVRSTRAAAQASPSSLSSVLAAGVHMFTIVQESASPSEAEASPSSFFLSGSAVVCRRPGPPLTCLLVEKVWPCCCGWGHSFVGRCSEALQADR